MTQAIRYGQGDASYRAAGEYEGVKALVQSFYLFMGTLPEAQKIHAMHSGDMDVMADKLTRFLCGWLGGPKLYREKYGVIHIPPAHRHLGIGTAERDAWLLCMEKALQEQDYAPEFKTYLLEQLARPAEFCRTKE